jgi:3'-5' exoribonuclease
MKKTWVADLAAGMSVDDHFVVASKTIREYARGQFLSLTLADRTGSVAAVLWDNAEAMNRSLKAGDVIRAAGAVALYNGALQVKIDRIGFVDPGLIDLADFRESLADPAEVEARLRRLLAGVGNEWLRRLIDAFLADDAFLARFRTAPAAKAWHHGFHGGLLLHTTELVELAAAVAPLFPDADRDLLLAGAFLHDLGKIHELEGELAIDYSTVGRLVGHIVLGHQMVLDRIRELPGFPPELRLHLQHLVLSHQGELAFASPVVPKSLEAILLHQMDDLNAQANAFRRIIRETRERGNEWSDWIRLIERQVWTGGPGGEE